jgi:hypothetical protein
MDDRFDFTLDPVSVDSRCMYRVQRMLLEVVEEMNRMYEQGDEVYGINPVFVKKQQEAFDELGIPVHLMNM